MDQISQLPDPILQHILFFLPAKDGAQTSLLSKTWLKVWNLLPVFTFDFHHNLSLWKLLSMGKEEPEQADVRDAFPSIIDGSLIDLRTQKAIIERFRLSLKLSYLKNASCIDEWIRLATNNCIKELDFHIERQDEEDWYSLPGTTLTAKSLMVLRLGGFKLEWPLIVDHINLTKLRELFLTDVFLEERIIFEICSGCPAIEDLSLIRCQGVKDLLISDLPKLVKLTLHQANEITQIHKSIHIRAMFLHTLYYRGCNSELKFEVTEFKHLKELSITFEQITDPVVEKLVSELPLLEKLELSFCLKLTRLKFSSRVLRQLAFRSYKSLTEIGIDTPNLLRYEYGAPKLPVIFSMTASSLQESHLKLMPNDHLSTSWFENLREYLTRFEQLNSLVLCITSMTNTFVVEELNATSSCPLSVVKRLKILKVVRSLNFETLLDGLLWTCHPETLAVDRIWEDDEVFVQFLKEKLMEREIVPACCDSRRFKCWRHYLKEVNVEICNKQFGDPSSSRQVSTICFKLRW
ncbi:putative F-box/LRR-repeat protein At5g02930 [Lycium ferocissimum]|uniref:putative F-box/LRR-repeat protein At5g02930 n=1 Tax=Lycium ferocissimum TaxID=112874 RepID=UPI0028158829|nr:putative F-box/LRR-repeat protein At5g02930 [Lycium ferocissimum]